MKNVLVAILVAVTAVMAGVVAYRLSADALAIIVGVLLGLLALIPALIIGVVLLRRSQPTSLPMPPAPQAPPVIVVSGGFHPAAFPQQMGMPMSQPQPPMLPAPAYQQPRQFRVMGYEPAETVDLHDEEWSSLG